MKKPACPPRTVRRGIPADGAGRVEEEEADRPLLRVAVDADLVAQRLARDGETAVVGQLAAEQPVDALPAVEGVDAEPGDEQQVGLPGFDHDPRGHPVVVQVPGARGDVGLRPDGAGAERERLRFQAHDAIGEQQRRLGHADAPAQGVLVGESGPEDLGDPPAGVNLKGASVEQDPVRSTVQAAGSCRCGPPSASLRSAAGDLPSAPPLRRNRHRKGMSRAATDEALDRRQLQ